MAITYAEYHKSVGASDDEIKVLDTPLARRAFDAQQRSVDEAYNRGAGDYETKAKDWFAKIEGEVAENNRKLAVAVANEARAKAAVLAARDQGLTDIAKDL